MSVPTSIVDYGCIAVFGREARAAVGDDTWAGMWFELDETLVVMLTDLDRASLITDEMLQMAGVVRFERAVVSLADLEERSREFEAALRDAEVNVLWLGVDQQNNRLNLEVVDDESVRPIVESIVGAFPVAITYNATPPNTTF
jgi:hypothetical protein